ncbi:MAG: vitamin B12 dependent-methionine synthase activation domain-containing protein [Bacteroides sp.]
MKQLLSYSIHEVAAYINWVYFFHAWGFQPRFAAIAKIHGCDACRASWLTSFPEEERPKAAEAMQLLKEANRMLNELDADFKVNVLFRLCKANASEDNLILDGLIFPLLRQQTKKREEGPYLCLSDFVRPLSSGVDDTVGVFAASIDADMQELYEKDPYKHLLVQTLSDRVVEASTEKMQEYLRINEHFQGIRPAVGYPSLPDQSVSFLLNELIDMSQIGIRLTENGAMYPHASVCGLLFAHPAAKYFSVGKIDDEQLTDYARRRGMSLKEMRKFLGGNLLFFLFFVIILYL